MERIGVVVVHTRRVLMVSHLLQLRLLLLHLLLLRQSHGLCDSIRLNHQLRVLQKSLTHCKGIDYPTWRQERVGGDLLGEVMLSVQVGRRKAAGLPLMSVQQLILWRQDRILTGRGKVLVALLLSQLA